MPFSEKIRLAAVLAAALLLAACGNEPPRAPAAHAPTAQAEGRAVAAAGVRAAEPQPDSAAAERFREIMAFAKAQGLHADPIGRAMQTLGEQFVGDPYVVGPLDGAGQEVLVCRLDGFDCFTFVEAMLALGRGVQQQDYSHAGYARRTREQRYRGGQMDGYCSRLHYFTEWIVDNGRRGHVENITRELGGRRLDKAIGFMGAHRDSYPRLAQGDASGGGSAERDSLYQCIQQMEARLKDQPIYYIPQDSIQAVYGQLQAGDLVAMATDIEGLDVTHTGLVYKGEDGSTGLLHASSEGAVTVSPDLQRYVQNVEAQIGIVIARPASSAPSARLSAAAAPAAAAPSTLSERAATQP